MDKLILDTTVDDPNFHLSDDEALQDFLGDSYQPLAAICRWMFGLAGLYVSACGPGGSSGDLLVGDSGDLTINPLPWNGSDEQAAAESNEMCGTQLTPRQWAVSTFFFFVAGRGVRRKVWRGVAVCCRGLLALCSGLALRRLVSQGSSCKRLALCVACAVLPTLPSPTRSPTPPSHHRR